MAGLLIYTSRIQRMLRWLFEGPNQFHPERTAEQVTTEAAEWFREIADNMRSWDAAPERIAHFLTKLVFCLFAEDVGLLPAGPSGKGLFTEIVEQTRTRPKDFAKYTQQLFDAMAQGWAAADLHPIYSLVSHITYGSGKHLNKPAQPVAKLAG